MAAAASNSATSAAAAAAAASISAASAAAASNSANSAAAPGPLPAPAIPAHCTHKNLLQEYAQRMHKKLPFYNIESEGEHHLLKFKCTVEVCGQLFSSTQSFSRRKEAEQDAARVAYEALVTKDKGDGKDVFELIDQGLVFCKSILHEFAVKTKVTCPSYSVAPQGKPMTLFVASVVFNGSTYTGEAATSKKDAEQKAAYTVVKSILATGNRCMVEIIRSKKNLITAINSSRNSKDRAVGQEVQNTPKKTVATFTPIKFTRPVAYMGGVQDNVALESQSLMAIEEHNSVTAVDPFLNQSTKSVNPSRKRKDSGSGVNEERNSK